LEEQQVEVLRRFSTRLSEAARAKSRQRGDVYWDLAAFSAVGLVLQDATAAGSLNADLRPVVAKVAQALEAGGGPVPLLFFGPPFAPERLRVSSFYAKQPTLRGYFRTRQWYSVCAFRLASPAETERALHLALLVAGDPELKKLHERLCTPYDMLLGPPDDAGVSQYLELASEIMGDPPAVERIPAALDAFRQRAARLPDPKINDQLLTPAQYANFAVETKGFRLLPPRSCPSAVILQRTAHPLVKGRQIPSGLDFFASGPLGCEAARRALRAAVGEGGVLQSITAAKAEPLPDSLHGKALGLLPLLQEPLPDSAPAPLRTDAWQDKQLWTALGAWAEQRHTWAGHLKLSVAILDGDEQPPGYVSPYPKFFRALGALVRQTATVINSLSEEPTPREAGQELLRRIDSVRQASSGSSRWDPRLHTFYRAYRAWTGKEDEAASREVPWGATVMERLARRWIDGKHLDVHDREAIRLWAASMRLQALHLLPELAELCDRLTAIAQKELDGQPFDKEDTALFRDYGLTLARLHFYDSQAWMYPQDDFPLATPVFANPFTDQVLYAGVGRPEALYVIVDVGGQRVLHRGAVLSYREFTRPTQEAVDDDSWTKEIQAGAAPAPPALTAAFRRATADEQSAECDRIRRRSSDQEKRIGPLLGQQNSQAKNVPPPPAAGASLWLRVIPVCILVALIVLVVWCASCKARS
jgi:hypothetical protein